MGKLSAIIITRNEENNIADVIKNVSFADEVIVVDNLSADKTVDIAKNAGAIVYSQKFSNFAQQRDFAHNKATKKWLLYIDADERLSNELVQEISNIQDVYGGYILRRRNFYLGKHEWPFIEEIPRLFLKAKLRGWRGKIHESAIFEGKTGILNSYLDHYTHKNLSSMIKKTNEWSDVEAGLLFKSGHPQMSWWRFLRIMLTKFRDSYFIQGGWKVGAIGFIESMYQAYSYFVVYAKLWELQRK
ncbi:MAG: glycosyltransferase family 2 protein [bacterium]|nr:glycosyltransferase family 2 protein [bacterium]